MRITNKRLSGSLAIAVAVLVTIGVVVSARATSRMRAIRRAAPPASETAAASSTQVDTVQSSPGTHPIAQMESELLTLTPHGFEPREIRRPAGRFFLMIENRSGLPVTQPTLALQAGATIRALRISREEANWSEVMNLSPGLYLLTEPNHPGWLCQITITAQ